MLDDGADSLFNTALQHVRDADLLIGGTRTLGLFDAYLKVDAQLFDLSAGLSALPDKIRSLHTGSTLSCTPHSNTNS